MVGGVSPPRRARHEGMRSSQARGSWLLCMAAVGFVGRGKDHYFLAGERGRADGNTGRVLQRLALESRPVRSPGIEQHRSVEERKRSDVRAQLIPRGCEKISHG